MRITQTDVSSPPLLTPPSTPHPPAPHPTPLHPVPLCLWTEHQRQTTTRTKDTELTDTKHNKGPRIHVRTQLSIKNRWKRRQRIYSLLTSTLKCEETSDNRCRQNGTEPVKHVHESREIQCRYVFLKTITGIGGEGRCVCVCGGGGVRGGNGAIFTPQDC